MIHSANILYVRRSSDTEDHQTLSIEQQIFEMRELAAKREIELDEVLTESASAREPGRPVFSELMKRIRAGRVGTLLAWKLDRLARNMIDGGELIHHLSKGDLNEIVTTEGTFTKSGDTKFILAMFFGAAAKYSDDLATAVKRGNDDVLRRGKVPGPVPLGYMKTHEHELVPGSGTVIPDPERFETVKRLWKEIMSGATNVSELWRAARNDWGLTTRPTKDTLARPIALTNLYAILRNPFYAGKIKRGETVYKGEHVPVVTWDEFLRVQKILRRKKVDEPHPHHEFLYQGLLRCACNHAFVGERHEKHGHSWTYYRCCARKPGYLVCTEVEVREADVTEAIAAVLETVGVDPTIQDWAFEAIAWWAGDDELSPEKQARRAKAQLASAEQGLTTLTDLVLKDFITEAEYKVRRVNQLAKIEHLREALVEPVQRVEAWRRLRDEKRQNGLGLAQDFRAGDAATKRRILARTCSGITMRDGKPHLELRAPFVRRADAPAPTDRACGMKPTLGVWDLGAPANLTRADCYEDVA